MTKEKPKLEDLDDNQKEAVRRIQESLNAQVHKFSVINGEMMRIYIYPNNQQIPVHGVAAMSVKPDGSHRLILSNDPSEAITMQAGWISIVHKGVPNTPYIFSD